MSQLFDSIGVGRHTLPNCLVVAPMNEANRNAFFGGDAQGYTDYPVLSEAQGA